MQSHHTSEDRFLCSVGRRQLERVPVVAMWKMLVFMVYTVIAFLPMNWHLKSDVPEGERSNVCTDTQEDEVQGHLGSFGWTRRSAIILPVTSRCHGCQSRGCRASRESRGVVGFRLTLIAIGSAAGWLRASQSALADAARGQWQPRQALSNNGAGFNHTAVPTQQAAAWTAFMRTGCDG